MLVDLILPAVLTVIMVSLSLGLAGADFARVLKSPRAFGLGAVNQLVLVPVTGLSSPFCSACRPSWRPVRWS